MEAALNGHTDTAPAIGRADLFDLQNRANESKKLAIEVAYDDLKEEDTPGDDYNTKGIDVAPARVVRAGFRLAALLNAIWPE